MSQHKFLQCVSFLTDRGVGQGRSTQYAVGSNQKFFFILFLCFFLISSAFAVDLTLENIISKIQSNQSRIKDMYAETTTTITSNFALPGSTDKGPKKMVQKGKMWTKGKDKSKIEMLSPMKQITITNGDQMAMINPETGQKMIQDLSKLKNLKTQELKNSGSMNLEKAKELFDLSATKKGDDYVIVGVSKKENKFLGKMEFYVDSDRWVPVKILMYDPKGKVMSQSGIEYQRETMDDGRETIWVPVKNVSNVTTPAGAMKVEMEFANIKINQGIKDEVFEVE